MRASRLLSMLILLQLRGRVTAQALADEFEVSVRTIYRDMDELSAAGVPVYADRGPGGGFQLLDGYRTKLTGMTPNEAETLLLAGLPGAAADLGLAEPLAAARLKLLAAMPASSGEGAARVGERFYLDVVDWYRHAPPPPDLATVAQAVWQNQRLSIRYESWSATTRRRVDPLGLVMKAGSWYMVARANGNLRTFKIANVSDVHVLDETFEHPPGFDLAAHWQAALQRFEKSLQHGHAVVRVSPGAMSRLDRLSAAAMEAVVNAAPGDDDWRQATIPIESVSAGATALLSFADEIEVLSPPELRAELARLAATVTQLYS
ncbi:MAG: transcriptional regulator [Ilumatobacteraceae bacterium]|nr:transcriptional regulator [Ilumatobacteraceae bacterium]